MPLVDRIRNLEDQFVERKEKGVSTEKIIATLVAFANSLRENEEATLFIGVSDDGRITGVDDADGMQKRLAHLAQETCYPSIRIAIQALEVEGKPVIGVTVFASADKPHFAGPSYIREGAINRKASKAAFDELIASRTAAVRPLLKARADGASVLVDRFYPGNPGLGQFRIKATITNITTHWVEFLGIDQQPFSLPIGNFKVRWEGGQNSLLVTELE